ncbi:MAG: hypothetical protein EOP21_00765 [Hyphomicrobiales bacterium]|nr:MAG: hypothetical protein EOP21_00765 [Hyphomicrobiales bacterium]
MDTDQAELPALAMAFDASTAVALLASFFAAAAAIAAASARHIYNPQDERSVATRDDLLGAFRARFMGEGIQATREAADHMLNAIGPTDTRAAHIRRVIGISAAQANSLHSLRQALYTYLDAPQRRVSGSVVNGRRVPQYVRDVDVDLLISATRGHLSAAQQRMLGKLLRSNVDLAGAEAALDRHAAVLRNARVLSIVGDTLHAFGEAAKSAGWLAAQRAGKLPEGQRRRWRTVGDERVRVSHAAVPGMNPGGVGLEQPFQTPLGPTFTPPLEYGCRCRTELAQ